MRQRYGSALTAAALLILSVPCLAAPAAETAAVEAPGTTDFKFRPAQAAVIFTPGKGAVAATANLLRAAKKSISLQLFTTPEDAIAGAVADAHKKGITVRLLLDKGVENRSGVEMAALTGAGLKPMVDHKPFIARANTIVIDAETILTGTFSLSADSEKRHVETLVVFKDCPELVKDFEAQFQQRWEQARPFETRSTVAASTVSSPRTGSTSAARLQGPVNLNSASAVELELLPGIGPALARRIIDYRTRVGRFRTVDELEKVSGIGRKTVNSVRALVTVQ